LLVVASGLRAGGALLNELLETTADHPVDSKIWFRENEARSDAFFPKYVTLGDLWSRGKAFSDVERGSWREKLRAYLLEAGVSERAIQNAHVHPEPFIRETLARLWETGVDVVHALFVPDARFAKPPPLPPPPPPFVMNLSSTAVLSALLDAFPESPTVCLRRRNVLDAYASLYRAERGVAPWQIIAEPPPAPSSETRGGLEPVGESDSFPKPLRTGLGVRFDPAVFAFLDAFQTEWMDAVEGSMKARAAVTDPGGGEGCATFTYEDDLADFAKQSRTLETLNARFSLRLNLKALPLQKMRRVSTRETTMDDFENPEALDERARDFLRDDA
jgi:hypothetical protein